MGDVMYEEPTAAFALLCLNTTNQNEWAGLLI